MAEELIIDSGTKLDKYQILLPQIKSLVGSETNSVANLSNIAAALKQTFGFFWVGFYLVEGKTLVLGPFQGPIACTRISKGKGVCGTAWSQKKTQLVPDVDKFLGHIACSSDAKSEIVIPILKENEVIAVLDVDSDQLNDFDATDKKYLNQLCEWLSGVL